MTIKPYSRNEIAKRSRKRQQIKKEEAEKLGVVQTKIWVSKEQVGLLKQAGLDVDKSVNEALVSFLSAKGLGDTDDLPMTQIEENSMIRQQRSGL